MRTLVHLILVLIAADFLMACNPSKLFLMQGTGIATYNRHTGQFEVLWEYTEREPMRIHDTIYVDSCKIGKRTDSCKIGKRTD